MKSWHITSIIAVLCSMAISEEIIEGGEAGAIKWGFETDVCSRYVDQGIAWSSGAVAQPWLWVSGWNFTLSTWADVLLSGVDEGPAIDEVDLILDYEIEWKKFTVAPTLAIVSFPLEEEETFTFEGYLKLSYAYRFISAFTTHSFDLATWAGAYYGNAGVAAAFDFTEKLSGELSTSFGWGSPSFNKVNWGQGPSWCADAILVSASACWYLNENIYIAPHLSLNFTIDPEHRVIAGERQVLFGGAAAGVEF